MRTGSALPPARSTPLIASPSSRPSKRAVSSPNAHGEAEDGNSRRRFWRPRSHEFSGGTSMVPTGDERAGKTDVQNRSESPAPTSPTQSPLKIGGGPRHRSSDPKRWGRRGSRRPPETGKPARCGSLRATKPAAAREQRPSTRRGHVLTTRPLTCPRDRGRTRMDGVGRNPPLGTLNARSAGSFRS